MGEIFVYVMTFGGAAVALVRPYYGLLVYILFAVIRPSALWFWADLPDNSSFIVAVAMLVGWAINGFGGLHFGRARTCSMLFISFWLWAALGAILVAPNKGEAIWYLKSMAKILAPFLVGATIITRPRQVRLLAWTIVIGMAYVCWELNLTYYEGFNRLRLQGFGAMDNNCMAIAIDCVIGLSLMLGLTARHLWQKGIALAATAVMMNAIFFSNSRGGMLGLMFVGAVAFFIVPKRPIHYVMFVVMALVGARLMGQEALDRFVTVFADPEARDKSAQSRLELWIDCWDAFKQSPILGVGAENWGQIAPRYGWPRGKYAHSLWVQTATETGIVGITLFVSFYGVCLLQMARMIFRLRDVPIELRDTGRMVIAGLIGFIIPAQFVSLWGLEVPYYVVLVGVAAYKVAAYEQAEIEEQAALDEERDDGWNTHPFGPAPDEMTSPAPKPVLG